MVPHGRRTEGTVPHISMVTLGVADLDRATAFYEAWGWERSSASVPGVVSFLHGSTAALGLFGRDALAADAGVPSAADGSPPAVALAMNLPDRDAVDLALTSASAAGAVISKEAEATDWGGYSGYVRDLDGHLWEVAHNPYFPLRADGGVTLPREA
jgi:uncharacterized protein